MGGRGTVVSPGSDARRSASVCSLRASRRQPMLGVAARGCGHGRGVAGPTSDATAAPFPSAAVSLLSRALRDVQAVQEVGSWLRHELVQGTAQGRRGQPAHGGVTASGDGKGEGHWAGHWNLESHGGPAQPPAAPLGTSVSSSVPRFPCREAWGVSGSEPWPAPGLCWFSSIGNVKVR